MKTKIVIALQMNNQQTLLEFAYEIQHKLDTCKNKEFSSIFVEAKMLCFSQYQNNLVTSSFHGINFFKNIILFWDNPESYCSDPKNTYEYNFYLIIKSNKELR